MRSIAIVDSGPLLASLVATDPQHAVSLEVLTRPDLDLVIPTLCITEVAYFLERRGHVAGVAAFLRGLRRFDVRSPVAEDWERIAVLVEKYADQPLGTVDASVVALAERLATDLLITLDHRHFGVVEPRHAKRFRLLPI